MRFTTHLLLTVVLGCQLLAIAAAQGPGFRGGRGPDKDFVTDRDDFHFLLEHHGDIRREVTELQTGVATVTESDNPAIAAKIRKHVAAMYRRVENNRPIRRRDPLFAELFRHADKIEMQVEQTANGVRVTETSDDAYVAQLIREHAKVVSGFVDRGFAEARITHMVPGRKNASSAPLHAAGEMDEMIFVEFDRVYIPALAFTNQANETRAGLAMERLSQSWNTRFAEHFRAVFAADPNWPADVDGISMAISGAVTALNKGDSTAAHEALEPVRDALSAARERNNFSYPLDTLSHYHATMEAIVKPATGLSEESLSEEQIETFVELSKRADREWAIVEGTEFDLGLFGKTDQQAAQFDVMLRGVRRSIETLRATLGQSDMAAILEAAKAMKPPFAKTYMFFGNFSGE